MSGPLIELPSPLPWRITFPAEVWSFNGSEVSLRTLWPEGMTWEADVPFDQVEHAFTGTSPTCGQRVTVRLEPIR
jgi:hypothetical protein